MPRPWIHYNVALTTALIAGFVTAASAQDYPNRPITLVVPFPPGGSTTIVARIVADKMSEALGQSIVVDNRGGAGGTVATRAVAKTSPDGYTILLGYTGTLAIGPTLYGNAATIRVPTLRPSVGSERRPTRWWCIPCCRSIRSPS